MVIFLPLAILSATLLIFENHSGRKAVEYWCKDNSKSNVSDHIQTEMMGHLGRGIQTIHLAEDFCKISATPIIRTPPTPYSYDQKLPLKTLQLNCRLFIVFLMQ